jgi:aspartate/methionine/tyrosine aminotransferase
VLVPSPTYTTHTLAESANAGAMPICYRLKVEDNWYPDLEEMRRQILENPGVAAIMLINPDNPTGMVYPQETLEKIVALAREFDLFIIADEVYNNIVYNGQTTVPISDVIGEVPALALKGISKEFPWPGSRCGWIEVYNFGRDTAFQKYVNAILTLKMNEVCSTTLPQKCIPAIMQHPQYPVYLDERTRRYEKMSNITYNFLKDVDGLVVNRTNGAFYMSVAFEDGLLNSRQSLPIENLEVKALVENLVNAANVSPDKRLVYYILAATGICIVPLSSFNTSLQGFRVTLLERDENECTRIYGTLAQKIREYLSS